MSQPIVEDLIARLAEMVAVVRQMALRIRDDEISSAEYVYWRGALLRATEALEKATAARDAVDLAEIDESA